MTVAFSKKLIYGALALLIVGVSFTAGLLVDFEFGDTTEIDSAANVEKIQQLDQASAISAHVGKDISWFAYSVGEIIGATAMAIESQSAPDINSALTSIQVVEAWEKLKNDLCADMISQLKDTAIELFGARPKEYPTLYQRTKLYRILFKESIARGQVTLDRVELDCDITTLLFKVADSYE